MMIAKIQKFREYLDYIEEHYNNVQEAWRMVQEKCPAEKFKWLQNREKSWIGIDVANHDSSKLSSAEFTQYRRKFFPCEGESMTGVDIEFKDAWEHHKTVNTHHWQNWTQAYKEYHPLAEMRLVSNLVDWIAMGIKSGSTAKEYYETAKDTIKFPEWAIKVMYEVFSYVYPERTFYRVANTETEQGLWYDFKGEFMGLIHNEFKFCMNSNLPMPYDKATVGWLSAAASMEELYKWFSKSDIEMLKVHGYKVVTYKAADYKHNGFHWLIKQDTSKLIK